MKVMIELVAFHLLSIALVSTWKAFLIQTWILRIAEIWERLIQWVVTHHQQEAIIAKEELEDKEEM